MKSQIALALLVAFGCTTVASANEFIRRAPVHTENHDTVVAAQGHFAPQGEAFPGATGCCERQSDCCDNIWEGYCNTRHRWCDHPYTGIFPSWGRHGNEGSCGTCNAEKACGCKGHSQKSVMVSHQKHGKKSCGGACCSYGFGLVAPGPCYVGHGKGKGVKFHLPKIHMPKVRMPKLHLPKMHLPKLGKGYAPKLHWPKLMGGKKSHVCQPGCGCGSIPKGPYTKGPGYGYQNSNATPVYLAPEEADSNNNQLPTLQDSDSDSAYDNLGPTDPTA